jgi:DNA-binding transcriptional ArsR family regulator
MTQLTVGTGLQVRARFFHGLADLSRLAILEALRGGELTAGEVASKAQLSASNASRHLACLKDCGLVGARQEWRRVYYRLAEGVAELLSANDQFIERVAERVAACERPEMLERADSAREGGDHGDAG